MLSSNTLEGMPNEVGMMIMEYVFKGTFTYQSPRFELDLDSLSPYDHCSTWTLFQDLILFDFKTYHALLSCSKKLRSLACQIIVQQATVGFSGRDEITHEDLECLMRFKPDCTIKGTTY